MVDIRIRDLPPASPPVASDFVPIDNGTTRKTDIQTLVETGRPAASQAEAEAGTDPTKAMTPLTTKQSIASERGVSIQAYSANLDTLAGIVPGAAGLSLLASPDGAEAAEIVGTFDNRADAALFNLSAFSVVMVNRWSSSSLYAPAFYKKVASEPTHAAKFQSSDGSWWEIEGAVIDIRSLGAMGDGVTSDTTAFVLGGSFTQKTFVIANTGSSYVVNGTITVNCRFVGVGMPTIALTVNGGTYPNADRGFWMKSNSAMIGLRIERGVTGSGPSGEFNNAIVVGEYATAGTEYTNILIDTVELHGVDAGLGRRSIFGAYGNTHDCIWRNLKITGYVSYGMMHHWGGDFDTAAPDTSAVTMSWHPRRITVEDVFMDSFDPDNGLGGIYLSACHDITVSRVSVQDCRAPFTVAAGDVGGLVAQGESANSVCKNLRFENCSAKNFSVVGFLVGGESGTRAGGKWYAIDNDVSLMIDGLSVERGALSTAARCVDLGMFQNIDVRSLNLAHQGDGFTTILTPGLFIQACNAVRVQGRTNIPFAHEVAGGTNIVIDTDDYCLLSNYDESAIGTRLTGQSGAHTLGAALAVNDTTVTLTDLDFDIVAGSTITVSGSTMTVLAAVGTSTTPVVISITPSLVAAANGTAATVEKATKNIDVRGFADRFQYGVYLINSSGGHAENVTVSKRFFRSGLHDVYARATRGLKIVNSAFYESGQTDVSSCNNIRMIDSCADVVISGCSFEDNDSAATKARHNIYLFGNNLGVSVTGNMFHRAQTSAINKFTPSTTTDIDHIIGDNWFGPNLPAGATGRISGTAAFATGGFGDRRIGFGTAAPTTGSWSQSDIIWNKNAAASGKAGWICTVAGSPGTWKTFAAIDA